MYFNISNFSTIDNLKKHIIENKKEYNLNKNIHLPDVIKESKNSIYSDKRDRKNQFFIK